MSHHLYVVCTDGVCGGRARISGTRISVRSIAELLLRGESFEEIAATYPHVETAALQDAIGYYLDHRSEISAEIEANELDNVLDRVGATLDSNGVISFRDPHMEADLEEDLAARRDLEALNRVYEDFSTTEEEKEVRRLMKLKQQERVKGEW